jgi:hypothetical protein
VYYPLAQQSGLQQPVYLTSAAGGAGTTWPSNLFSQYNLANLSATSTSNTSTGTSSPQTVYELPLASFESPSSTNTQTGGQQLYWPSYN